jgi:uncharacterized protein YjiS (DUF1127 family)
MALYETSASGASSAATGLIAFFDAFVGRIATWQRSRATARALRSLSSAQLADIGIEPGDIDGFAEQIARRRA